MKSKGHEVFVGLLVGAALSLSGSLTVVSSAGAASLKTWSTIINKPSRFKVLKTFNSEAVLDQETGLVWQRDAGNGVANCSNPASWSTAVACCASARIGGRGGWRLPTYTEFYSLVDVTQSNPALPLGHPFTNVQNSDYWVITEEPSDDATPDLSFTWAPNLAHGSTSDGNGKLMNSFYYWCVRGPGSN